MKNVKLENELLEFANDFCNLMDWPLLPIERIKVSKMRNYKGWMIPHPSQDCLFIILSQYEAKDNKDLFSTLIHELIHGHILVNTKHHAKAHKHGKRFKKLAKKVEEVTNGFYTVNDIL